MTGRGIARHGYKVMSGAREIGLVTSGTFSPTLNKAIGLAFVDIEFARRIRKYPLPFAIQSARQK